MSFFTSFLPQLLSSPFLPKATELLEANQPLGKAEWTAPEIEKINELIPGAITTKVTRRRHGRGA